MSRNDGRVIGSKQIVGNAASDQRWNLVILSEGYQEAELGQFETDAQHFAEMLKATSPFDELWCGINIYRVNVASTDSGADDEGCRANPKSTFFDARFCSGGNAVLLTVDDDTAGEVARTAVPEVDQVAVIVNSKTYGGSGSSGTTMVFSLGQDDAGDDAALTGIHELGHSLVGLADEYGGEATTLMSGGDLAEPNVSVFGSLEDCKWGALVTAQVMPTVENRGCLATATPNSQDVGTFEGARNHNCGVYRPMADCKMRTISAPFCEVCKMEIRKKLAPYTITINATTASLSFTSKEGSAPENQAIVSRSHRAVRL
jgi:hypothetical protein